MTTHEKLLHAIDEAEAARAARSLYAVGLFGVAGWHEGGGDENEDIVVHLVPRDAIPKFIEQKRAEGLGLDAKLLLLLNF